MTWQQADSLSNKNKLLIRCAWTGSTAFASAGYDTLSWASGSCPPPSPSLPPPTLPPPPPSSPPPLEVVIDPLGDGDYKTIEEALATETQRFPGKELVMRLSAGTHVVGGLVFDANLTLGRLEITAASDASTITSNSNTSTLLEVRTGAPPIKLLGLKLDGEVLLKGGTIEISACRYGSASASRRRRLEPSITCPDDTTSLSGTTSCSFCKTGFYNSAETNGTVANVECAPCLKPDGGATCSEITTSGSYSLAHGSTSLATVRIEPNYWRLSARSTTLSLCLQSEDSSSSCVGGSDAGDENDYKQGYAGSGYCKEGHTGPLCQVCNTSDFYFDSVEAMECIQCPSDRLQLPVICTCVLAVLLLAAVGIKWYAPRPHPFTVLRVSFPLLLGAVLPIVCPQAI